MLSVKSPRGKPGVLTTKGYFGAWWPMILAAWLSRLFQRGSSNDRG